MSDQPRYRWFQFSLITAVLMTVVTSLLLWRNISYYEIGGKDIKGWPVALYYRYWNGYEVNNDGRSQLQCKPAREFWQNLGIDVALGLGCLGLASIACEWLVRRDGQYSVDEKLRRRRIQFRLSMLAIWLSLSGATLWTCVEPRTISHQWSPNEWTSHSRWRHNWFRGQEFGWPIAYLREGFENSFTATPENHFIADEIITRPVNDDCNWRNLIFDVTVSLILMLVSGLVCLWLIRRRDANTLSTALVLTFIALWAIGLDVLVCEPPWRREPLASLALLAVLGFFETLLLVILAKVIRRHEATQP